MNILKPRQDGAQRVVWRLLERAFLVAQMAKEFAFNTGSPVQLLVWEDPLEKGMAAHSTICLENPMDKGASWVVLHGVPKTQTQLSN